MLIIDVLVFIFSSQLLVQAATELQPVGTVEVFYRMDPLSMETFELTSGVLEGYSGIYTVDYHLISDPWPGHLLESAGIDPEDIRFAVAVNGSFRTVLDGDTVKFLDLPARMHGTGGPRGNWELGDLEAALRDSSSLTGGIRPEDRGNSTLADRILEDAVSYLGTPYVWGGTDGRGFDCSGLAYRVFNDNGVPIPRSLGAMEEMGIPVDRDELQPGDLLIFDNPRHSGIYMGNGDFIHCSSWRDRGVVITPITQSSYARRYSSAVRILGTGPDY